MPRLPLLIAIVSLLGPSSAFAQDGAPRGFFLGLGAGMGMVRSTRLDQQAAGPMLQVSTGWGLAHGITPMLESGGFRMLDENLPLGEAATSRVLKTSSLLASVQVGLPRAFFVRPGVGVATHSYAVPDPAADSEEPAKVRSESGFAAGLALGRTVVVARKVPVSVETVGLWSHGGSITGPRWAAGVQAVALFRWPTRGARQSHRDSHPAATSRVLRSNLLTIPPSLRGTP